MTVRVQPSRRAGGALLAFGASGIALLLAATVLVLGSLSAVDDAVTGFERQRTELVGMLDPAADTLSDAADAASRAGVSLTQASDAADRGAGLAASLADSFDGLATLGSFELLGARPFAGLSGQFIAVGTQARALSTSLQATAASMRANAGDSAAVSGDLRALAAQLQNIAASAGASSGGPATGNDGEPAASSAVAAIGLLRMVLLGILAWLAVPAIASGWFGWRMLRSAPA